VRLYAAAQAQRLRKIMLRRVRIAECSTSSLSVFGLQGRPVGSTSPPNLCPSITNRGSLRNAAEAAARHLECTTVRAGEIFLLLMEGLKEK